MTGPELDPDLQRLGEALRASAAIDLAREATATPAAPASSSSVLGRGRRGWRRLRNRALAGSTLGLAALGAGLVLALGGTATTAPAFAVTREPDGSVLVRVNTLASVWVLGADEKLAAMGIDERINVGFAPGPAPERGPLTCRSESPASRPQGVVVRVLLDANGTARFPRGNTGVGPTGRGGAVHLAECIVSRDDANPPRLPAVPRPRA